ncbi:MAG: hypothetical protein NC541_07205 [bacterium]|nr:hypothetical protein [bacterium]
MQLKRLFSTADVKGTQNYLATQKKYEILRTVLYFGVSAALFLAGLIQTKSRLNLLTVVAVLGCLPASKSAVSAVMFLRYHSCLPENAAEIKRHDDGLDTLFDCIFTSYSKNYIVNHLAVRGGAVCGFTEDASFDESAFYKHISDILKLDGHKDITVKVFRSLPRYTERLEQMKLLQDDPARTRAVTETLKSVIL